MHGATVVVVVGVVVVIGVVVVVVEVIGVVVAWIESIHCWVLQQQDWWGHDPQGEYWMLSM